MEGYRIVTSGATPATLVGQVGRSGVRMCNQCWCFDTYSQPAGWQVGSRCVIDRLIPSARIPDRPARAVHASPCRLPGTSPHWHENSGDRCFNVMVGEGPPSAPVAATGTAKAWMAALRRHDGKAVAPHVLLYGSRGTLSVSSILGPTPQANADRANSRGRTVRLSWEPYYFTPMGDRPGIHALRCRYQRGAWTVALRPP
jgi:hypothetical protein